MPKITEEPLDKIQIRLFASDHHKLKQIYGNTIGVTMAVRTLIRSHVQALENEANKAIDSQEAKGTNA